MSRKLSGQFGGLPIIEGEEAAVRRTAEKYDIMHGTHGTASDDGTALTHVTPSIEHGREVFQGVSDPQRAYYSATPIEGVLHPEGAAGGFDSSPLDVSKQGWMWARDAVESHRNVGREGFKNPGSPNPRPMVHHVVPEGKLGIDPVLNSAGGLQQVTSSRLKVVDTEWIPRPRMAQVGVQGTLPNENWNKWPAVDAIGPVPENNYKEINPRMAAAAEVTRPAEKPQQVAGQLSLDIVQRREGVAPPVVKNSRARRR